MSFRRFSRCCNSPETSCSRLLLAALSDLKILALQNSFGFAITIIGGNGCGAHETHHTAMCGAVAGDPNLEFY